MQRCTDLDVGGIVIHVASLDDIIDSKTHANRPKDHDALPELHRLRGTRSDDP
jgi:predicted nucleotidyltransferase